MRFFAWRLLFWGAGAWVIDRSGHKLGLLDKPNEWSSHYSPTPKDGGIRILAAFVFVSSVVQIPCAFWGSATFLALLSFCGDRLNFSPTVRLPIQFIAVLILVLPVLWMHVEYCSGNSGDNRTPIPILFVQHFSF